MIAVAPVDLVLGTANWTMAAIKCARRPAACMHVLLRNAAPVQLHGWAMELETAVPAVAEGSEGALCSDDHSRHSDEDLNGEPI